MEGITDNSCKSSARVVEDAQEVRVCHDTYILLSFARVHQ